MDSIGLKESATDAIKYWEPRRILYNIVLAAIVLLYFVLGLPRSKTFLSTDLLQSLFLLAVLANVAYCAAYIFDMFAQASGFREQWRKCRRLVLAIGIVFASILTRVFAMGMFGM